MNLIIGEYNTLTVLRETELAYMLGDENTEVFLHRRQVVGTIKEGDAIEVFLYYDNQKRPTATMVRPLIDQDHPAFIDVVDVNYRLGIFLNFGLIKDLLMSRDDLPFMRKDWPKKGDRLFVRLRVSKNQLTAKFVPRFEINDTLKPTDVLEVGQEYDAYNVFKTEEGNVFFTETGNQIYVYFKHMRKEYRLGEKATIKITIDKGNLQYSGTLIKQKELMLSADAEYIKQYLDNKEGVMPYTDKSTSEAIQEKFRMSKNAFKRAIGSLYKQNIVLLEKDRTILVEAKAKEVEEETSVVDIDN